MNATLTRRHSVACGVLAAAASVVVALFSAPAAVASDCRARCDSNYYFCNRGGASPGERSCATARSICTSACLFAKTSFGAIAYSKAAQVHGASSRQDSEGQAAAAALHDCRSKAAGATDCAVLVHFYDRCGALALGDQGAYGSDHAPGRRAAADKALAYCRPHGGATCRVARVVCTP